MASAESIAIRCDKALAVLETELARLGVDVTPIPRLSRDKIMLRAIQLEALVGYVQQINALQVTALAGSTARRKPGRKPRKKS